MEGRVEKVIWEEVVIATKANKAAEPSEVSAKMRSSRGEKLMRKFSHCVSDGKKMSDEWQTGVLVPIIKEKGDVKNCNAYKSVKLLKHAI